MAEYLDNPAGRLHKFFMDVTAAPGQTVAWDAVGGILGVDDPRADQATLFRRLSLIVSYPPRIETLIRSVDGEDHDLLLRWLPAVQSTLGTLANGIQVQQFRGPISPEVLYGIESCSSLLHRRLREPEPQEQGVQNLLLLIEGFIGDLEAATEDLPKDVRAGLRDIAYHLRDAAADLLVIRDYRVLSEAVEAAVGWLVLHPEARKDEQSRPIIEKLGKVVGATLAVLSFMTGAYQLAADFIPQLPHGETTSVVHDPPPKVDIVVVELPPPPPVPAEPPDASGSS